MKNAGGARYFSSSSSTASRTRCGAPDSGSARKGSPRCHTITASRWTAKRANMPTSQALSALVDRSRPATRRGLNGDCDKAAVHRAADFAARRDHQANRRSARLAAAISSSDEADDSYDGVSRGGRPRASLSRHFLEIVQGIYKSIIQRDPRRQMEARAAKDFFVSGRRTWTCQAGLGRSSRTSRLAH